MIYDRATGVDTSNGVITKTTQKRITIHSMFYNDVRHDWTNTNDYGSLVIRGNIRQVGSTVTTCGPGVITAGGDERCTWNWNYEVNAGDAEGLFGTAAPFYHGVWAGSYDRNYEAEVFSEEHMTKTHEFSVVFQTDNGTGKNWYNRWMYTDDVFELEAAKYFTVGSKSGSGSRHSFSFSMHCLVSSADGNGDIITGNAKTLARDDSNIRDMFPDCYFGDEIHFTYTTANTLNAMNDLRLSAWYSFTEFPSSW